jgi:hypothetical protein
MRDALINRADRMIKEETEGSHHSLQEWILIMIKTIQEKKEGDIQEIMNKIFLIYKDIIPNEYLGMEFQQVEGGVYSEEVEDTLDDSLFGKYISVREVGTITSISLTGRGYDYAANSLTEEDYPFVKRISFEGSTWEGLIAQGRFTHYIYKKFREYSDLDPRTKITKPSSSPEQTGGVSSAVYDTMNNIMAQLNSQNSQIIDILNSRLDSIKIVQSNIEHLQKQIAELTKQMRNVGTALRKERTKGNIWKIPRKRSGRAGRAYR